MMDKDKPAGVCKHTDCLADAVYKDLCRYHAGDIPCEHCGEATYEHVAIDVAAGRLLLCAKSVYKQGQ